MHATEPNTTPRKTYPSSVKPHPQQGLKGLALVFLAGLLSTQAQALQIVDARDGQTVFAKVSRQEITRIGFEHGRVRKVTGNAGEFILDKDEQRGHIFIRPTDPQSGKPINLFISSDQHTVALLLQPVDLPSDTIVIREPRTQASTHHGNASSSQQHVRQMKNLLVAIAGDHLPEDMEVQEPGATLPTPLSPQLPSQISAQPHQPGLLVNLQRRLVGEYLVAEKLLLTHLGSAPQAVDEVMLYGPGVMAVAIEQRLLQPGQASAVFVIRERRGDE